VNASLIVRMIAALAMAGFIAGCSGLIEGDGRHMVPLSDGAKSRLASMGSSTQAPMMVRLYKQEAELEVWKQVKGGSYKLFQTYEICDYSGQLGPKHAEGDRQSPEGFYTITPGLMNPRSNYYLAFNLGFPNKFDRAHGRTGSNLMVHGDCSSRGCYAMTDESIAEIYALARESFQGGNDSFQVQIYPFRMTAENFARHRDNENMSYWRNLHAGYLHTEITNRPPDWDVCGREYVFNVRGANGQGLDARAACPPLQGDAQLLAEVSARQQAHMAAYRTRVAALEEDAARAASEQARLEANQQAIAERGEAINQTVEGMGNAVGGFFAGLFGGEQVPQSKTPQVPAGAAPVPATRPQS